MKFDVRLAARVVLRVLLVMATCLALAGCADDGDGDSETDVVQDTADTGDDVAEDTGEDTADDTADDSITGDTADQTDSSDATDATDADDTSDAGDTSDTSDMTDAGDMDDADMTMVTNGGDTCAEALDVTAGGTFEGQSTVDANDDYSADASVDDCPSGTASGNDVVYSVSPQADTTYTFTVTPDGLTFDPMIYARDDCSMDACIDGTVLNGPGDPESLELMVTGGSTVYVIVDGELLSEGAFTLEVAVQ